MSQLTKSDVVHVASLANIKLSESEVDKYRKQLDSVIGHVSELSEVETHEITPVSQTTGLTNIERDDVALPQNSLTQDQALGTSSSTYNGYFKVDAILTERTDK